MTLLVLALSVAGVLAQPPADQTARVAGRVVVAGSSSPVAGAQVMLIRVRTGPGMPSPVPGQPPRRTTDEAGRFVFEQLPAGDYLVHVSKAGFFEDGPAFTAGARPAAPRQIAAGQALDLGDLPLARGGAIAGRVLDSSGEPIGGAQVAAMHLVPQSGPNRDAPSWIPVGAAEHTNDLGEFRLFGIPPGECIVAAAPPRSADGRTLASTIETTTFAPGTTDPRAAARLMVPSGDTVSGIEVRLVTAPTFQVSGIVVNPKGEPVSGATVYLEPDRTRFIGGPLGGLQTTSDGRFVIGSVVPGTYQAWANVPAERLYSAGAVVGSGGSGAAASMPARTSLVVTDGDIAAVRIVIQAR